MGGGRTLSLWICISKILVVINESNLISKETREMQGLTTWVNWKAEFFIIKLEITTKLGQHNFSQLLEECLRIELLQAATSWNYNNRWWRREQNSSKDKWEVSASKWEARYVAK